MLGGGNSQCVIVRQRTSDKSSAAKLEDNLNRCRKKKSNFNLSKIGGMGSTGLRDTQSEKVYTRKRKKS